MPMWIPLVAFNFLLFFYCFFPMSRAIGSRVNMLDNDSMLGHFLLFPVVISFSRIFAEWISKTSLDLSLIISSWIAYPQSFTNTFNAMKNSWHFFTPWLKICLKFRIISFLFHLIRDTPCAVHFPKILTYSYQKVFSFSGPLNMISVCDLNLLNVPWRSPLFQSIQRSSQFVALFIMVGLRRDFSDLLAPCCVLWIRRRDHRKYISFINNRTLLIRMVRNMTDSGNYPMRERKELHIADTLSRAYLTEAESGEENDIINVY